jgi:hypothetical protein
LIWLGLGGVGIGRFGGGGKTLFPSPPPSQRAGGVFDLDSLKGTDNFARSFVAGNDDLPWSPICIAVVIWSFKFICPRFGKEGADRDFSISFAASSYNINSKPEIFHFKQKFQDYSNNPKANMYLSKTHYTFINLCLQIGQCVVVIVIKSSFSLNHNTCIRITYQNII